MCENTKLQRRHTHSLTPPACSVCLRVCAFADELCVCVYVLIHAKLSGCGVDGIHSTLGCFHCTSVNNFSVFCKLIKCKCNVKIKSYINWNFTHFQLLLTSAESLFSPHLTVGKICSPWMKLPSRQPIATVRKIGKKLGYVVVGEISPLPVTYTVQNCAVETGCTAKGS